MDRGSRVVDEPKGRFVPGGDATGPVGPTATARSRVRPLGLGDVVLDPGSELGRFQARNSDSTIPHCIEQVQRSGAIGNLEDVADGRSGSRTHRGMVFSDSDVYKVLEAAAWDSLRGSSAPARDFLERASSIVARAQRGDGYLDSWVQGDHPDLAWNDLRWGHE